MWYAKPARKTYQKNKFKKDDFIWYTREGLEKQIKVTDPNQTLRSDFFIANCRENLNFRQFQLVI